MLDKEGNNMWTFHHKLERLSNILSTLSKREFGETFNMSRLMNKESQR